MEKKFYTDLVRPPKEIEMEHPTGKSMFQRAGGMTDTERITSMITLGKRIRPASDQAYDDLPDDISDVEAPPLRRPGADLVDIQRETERAVTTLSKLKGITRGGTPTPTPSPNSSPDANGEVKKEKEGV